MKKYFALIGLSILLPLSVQAGDLKYQYDESDSYLLKDYDGEPWWVMLSNCAGYHTAAAATEGVPPEVSTALRRQANYFATLASFRLAKDNSLEKTIHDPVIDVAERAAENAMVHGLVADPSRQASMRTLCGAHVNAYERMVPGMELQ